MTRFAMYNHDTGQVAATFTARAGEDDFARGKYVFPNGDSVRPIQRGWKDGPWEVLEIVEFVVPSGKRPTGAVGYGAPVDGTIAEQYAVEDIPAPGPADTPLQPFEFHAMVAYLGRDTDIRTAIAAITDPLQRAVALTRYERATAYHRDDPLLAQIAATIGMTDAEIDSAWTQIVGLR